MTDDQKYQTLATLEQRIIELEKRIKTLEATGVEASIKKLHAEIIVFVYSLLKDTATREAHKIALENKLYDEVISGQILRLGLPENLRRADKNVIQRGRY